MNPMDEARSPGSLARASKGGNSLAWLAAPLPTGVELAHNTLPARWVEERAGSDVWTVGQLLPDTFEAYARVFHPAYRAELPVRWSTVASWTGRRVHPLMAFERIAAIPDGPKSKPEWGYRPAAGAGPIDELVTVLRSFTTSPERCWMGLWDGFGGLDMVDALKSALRLRLPHRAYILLNGPIDAVRRLGRAGPPWKAPNLWWPDDRAWFVSSDIDLASTYVGGSRLCIDAILADESLEALPSDVHDSPAVVADTLNPPVTPTS
jgi:hypothetical protein